MKQEMEKKIKDLEDLLRRERENLEGNAKEREQQLKREVEEWKQKLADK